MKLGSNLDFSSNQALNLVLHQLSGAPSSPKPGQTYFNTSSYMTFVWNGSAWRPTDAAGLTDGSVAISALATNPLARANHTGTQPSSTISDLAATVKSYTLDTFAAPAAAVSFGGQRAASVAAATTGTDAPNWTQVQNLVAAAVAGQTAIKNPARAYAAGNITLSGTQTLDGVSLNAGDRVLVANQSTASQNGLYVVASGSWALAADGNSAAAWTEGTEILVAEGTAYGGAIFRQGTASPTLTTLTFVQTAKTNTYSADGTTLSMSGTVLSAKLGNGITTDSNGLAIDRTKVPFKSIGTITGDGSTTSFQFTHGLGTAACHLTVRDSSGNQWLVDNTLTSTTATVAFGSGNAPASNVTFSVIVTG